MRSSPTAALPASDLDFLAHRSSQVVKLEMGINLVHLVMEGVLALKRIAIASGYSSFASDAA